MIKKFILSAPVDFPPRGSVADRETHIRYMTAQIHACEHELRIWADVNRIAINILFSTPPLNNIMVECSQEVADQIIERFPDWRAREDRPLEIIWEVYP